MNLYWRNTIIAFAILAVWAWAMVVLANKLRPTPVHAAPARVEKQVTLTPDQIKKAVCEGPRDANGTYINCWVFPKGSKL